MVDPVERTCGQCGYDLSGLGARGACPECGQAYDIFTGQGLTAGRAEKHRRGDKLAARLRTIFFALAAVGIMACGGVMSLAAQSPLRPIAIATLFAVAAALAAVTSYLYEDD